MRLCGWRGEIGTSLGRDIARAPEADYNNYNDDYYEYYYHYHYYFYYCCCSCCSTAGVARHPNECEQAGSAGVGREGQCCCR